MYFCTLFDVILNYSMVTVELKPKRNICSTQSENLRTLEIVLCILRILRLRNYSVQSYACTLVLNVCRYLDFACKSGNLEIARMCYTISGLAGLAGLERNLKILRMHSAISRLCKFSDSVEHISFKL